MKAKYSPSHSDLLMVQCFTCKIHPFNKLIYGTIKHLSYPNNLMQETFMLASELDAQSKERHLNQEVQMSIQQGCQISVTVSYSYIFNAHCIGL